MKTPTGTALRLLLVFFGLAAGTADAAPPTVRYEPPAPWIESSPLATEAETPHAEIRDGIYILLFERQTKVSTSQIETFERLAQRIISQPGVDSTSQLNMAFDPSFQTLVVHSARILRGDHVVDALDRSAVKLLQRETNLEYGIYDGTFTASLFLADVRVGDIVDYSFTIRGQNPVFAGRFMEQLWSAGPHPYHRLRFRVLWPTSRRLHVKNHGTGITPAIHPFAEHTEYVWDLADTKPLLPESELPAWYHPYPWTQLSEFSDWNAVATWGASLFATPAEPSHAIQELAARIAGQHASPHDRLLAALRFVQDEVRYLGIEVGPNSHQPHYPDAVLRRRFGDCKDKSVLLIAVLRELGIRALPALVHTDRRTHVEALHPSPDAFNHVIVRVEIDHQDFWVDPTPSYQGGALDGWAYETTALALTPETTALERIPKRLESRPTTEIQYEFHSPDLETPTSLVVTTVARAEAANDLREHLLSSSRDEIRNGYLDYYSSKYDNIETAGEVEFDDDRGANVVRVQERYAIRDFWKKLDDGRSRARYYPMEIRSRIFAPDTVKRTMPIGRRYPDHISIAIRATVPKEFRLAPEAGVVEDPAFRLRWREHVEARILEAYYEYESLSDSVSPDQAADYIKHIREARNLLSTTIWGTSGTPFWTTQRKINYGVFLPLYLLLMASPVLGSLARIASMRGRVQRAIGYATWGRRFAVIGYRPVLNRARFGIFLASLYMLMARHAEAEALATNALQRTATGGKFAKSIHVDALYLLCSIHERHNRLQEAKDCLNRAENLAQAARKPTKPQQAGRLLSRVFVDARLGNTEGAEESIVQAERLGFGDRLVSFSAHATRAAVLEADGDYEGSRRLFSRVLCEAVETFGPGHPYTAGVRSDLTEFEKRHGIAQAPRGEQVSIRAASTGLHEPVVDGESRDLT